MPNSPHTVGAKGPVKPHQFFTPSSTNTLPSILDVFDTVDSFSQDPYSYYLNYQTTDHDWVWEALQSLAASDIILMSYTGYRWPQDKNVDEEGWNLPVVTGSTDTILMGYKGYSVPLSNRIEMWESNQLPIVIIPLVDFTLDNDSENQFAQVYTFSDWIDERNNLPIIPVMGVDNDAESQKAHSLYTPDGDITETGVESLQYSVLLRGWEDYDTPLLLGWTIDPDLTDLSVRQIILSSIVDFTLDNDVEQQLGQPQQFNSYQLTDDSWSYLSLILSATITDHAGDYQTQWPEWNKDYPSDEDIERFSGVIPITDFTLDNDVEQQISQASWYSDQADERNVLPIIPNLANNDENQIPQVFTFSDWIDERNVLPPIVAAATDTILMGYRGYNISLANRIAIPEFLLLPVVIIPPIDFTWDDPSDNQIAYALQFIDLTVDMGVELITLPPFIDIIEIVGEEEE